MMRGSSYLNSSPKRAQVKPRRFKSLAAIFLVLAVFLSGFASLPIIDALFSSSDGAKSESTVSEASALWCADPKEGNLGYGMDNRSDWRSGSAWYPHSETNGRVLTSQEAFGNGIQFTNFGGAGQSPGLPWFWISPPVGLPEADDDSEEGLKSVVSYTGNTPEGAGAENWFTNMNNSRTPTKCVMGTVGAAVANGVLGLTSGITNLMGGIATFAFDPNFICDPDDASATNCIDLVGIIGGNGGASEGIIGKLTTSVYFPLLVIAALLVGIWIAWNGIAKRQIRETLMGALWSLGVIILGIAMLLNPLMLAKAPMVVGNALTSCVIGAFTGSGGCASGLSAGSGSTSGETVYCEASSNKAGFMDQAAITMTSMSCELWKSFVLQPYAQGAFGAPLDQLETNRSGSIANQLLAKNPGLGADTFCVDTKVNGTLDSNFGKTLALTVSGDKICNLAVYQAYLGVDAQMNSGGGGTAAAAGAIDGRWLKLAQVAASDDGMYRSWAPSDWHISQIMFALLGLLSALMATIVIFVVAAFALAFYVTSILMIAFAPFFLLVGVHPGKGRKIMMGWLGQVLSNLMKYVASAIFLVITMAIYGAVLSNVSNPGAILIFMIILTVALLMYRKEIVDMVGVIDLGGEKLSNRMSSWAMDKVNNTGKTAMAVGGGTVAGMMANGVRNPFSREMRGEGNVFEQAGNFAKNNIRHSIQDANSIGRAAVDSGRRSIKSRPGFASDIMRASDRISSDNRADMANQTKAADIEAQAASGERVESERAYENSRSELETSRATAQAQLKNLGEEHSQAKGEQLEVKLNSDNLDDAQEKALSAVTIPDFREYQDLLNQMKDLEIKAVIAEESGLHSEAAAYRETADGLRQNFTEVESRLSDEAIQQGSREYDTALAEQIEDPRVNADNVSDYEDDVRGRYQDVLSTLGRTAAQAGEIKAAQATLERELEAKIVDSRIELEDATYRESNTREAASDARQRVIDLKPGQVVKNSKVRKNQSEIEAKQNDRSRELGGVAGRAEDRLIDLSERHLEAREDYDRFTDEIKGKQEAVKSSKEAYDQIEGVRRNIDVSKEQVAESWRKMDPAVSGARERKAFIDHRDASAASEAANARVEALTSKETSEGRLSESDRSELFIARSEAKSAQDRIASSERLVANSGKSMDSMRESFEGGVQNHYNRTRVQGAPAMDEKLGSFEAKVDGASTELRREISNNQSELKSAQRDQAEAAERMSKFSNASKEAATTAQRLGDRSSDKKAVSDKDVSKAEKIVAKIADPGQGRGIPRTSEEAQPQPQSNPADSYSPQPLERRTPSAPPVPVDNGADRITPVAQPNTPSSGNGIPREPAVSRADKFTDRESEVRTDRGAVQQPLQDSSSAAQGQRAEPIVQRSTPSAAVDNDRGARGEQGVPAPREPQAQNRREARQAESAPRNEAPALQPVAERDVRQSISTEPMRNAAPSTREQAPASPVAQPRTETRGVQERPNVTERAASRDQGAQQPPAQTKPSAPVNEATPRREPVGRAQANSPRQEAQRSVPVEQPRRERPTEPQRDPEPSRRATPAQPEARREPAVVQQPTPVAQPTPKAADRPVAEAPQRTPERSTAPRSQEPVAQQRVEPKAPVQPAAPRETPQRSAPSEPPRQTPAPAPQQAPPRSAPAAQQPVTQQPSQRPVAQQPAPVAPKEAPQQPTPRQSPASQQVAPAEAPRRAPAPVPTQPKDEAPRRSAPAPQQAPQAQPSRPAAPQESPLQKAPAPAPQQAPQQPAPQQAAPKGQAAPPAPQQPAKRTTEKSIDDLAAEVAPWIATKKDKSANAPQAQAPAPAEEPKRVVAEQPKAKRSRPTQAVPQEAAPQRVMDEGSETNEGGQRRPSAPEQGEQEPKNDNLPKWTNPFGKRR